jgi:1-acyl-sn-glycerol-3-phosphate acyltransferase
LEDDSVRAVDFVATAAAWGWLGLTLVLFDPVLRIASLLGAEPMDRAVGLMCRVLGGSIRAGLGRLELEGLENIPPQGSYIVVSNHQSLVESFLPLWLLQHLRPRYIAKKPLGGWIPAVSFNLRRGGHCLIDREDREEALAAIAELGRRVDSGEVSALIFPEGTRSVDGRINPFKPAGLATLLQTAPRAEILPMLVHGGNHVFPRGLPRVRAGSTVRVQFWPVLVRGDSDVEETIERIRQVLTSRFAELEARFGSPPA